MRPAVGVELPDLDADRLGSLYGRLLDGLVLPDAQRQARVAAQPIEGSAALHPWYPVLRIGRRKAELSKRALVAGDPSWLLRVSVHLELLTFLGVAEAVRPDGYELLSPGERAACEHTRLAHFLVRLNRDGWQAAWAHRTIAWARRGRPRTGAVAAHNVLRKRRATLGFLAVHHQDLLSAIELAGPNHDDAQQALQQVFSDAERAVLQTVQEAFPELWALPADLRELALRYRRRSVGLLASAAKHYRRSLNAVAAEALRRQLVSYAGDECVPRAASVIETAGGTESGAELLLRLELGRR
ncbi:MAG TPA: hypothetical protein VFV85_05665 [Conexibacter sp.]|nr:hypothetical protein [Conexibacter sp.]